MKNLEKSARGPEASIVAGHPSGATGGSTPQAPALLAAIIASGDDALISTSLDGTVLTWNAGAERIFGYTAAEMTGGPVARLLPVERLHEEAALITRLLAGETIPPFQTRRLRKDGSPIDVSITLSPIRDAHEAIVAVSEAVHDFTAVQAQQAALAQVSRDLQTIVDQSPVQIGAWNADLTNRFANKAYAATFGWTATELRGRHLREFLGAENFARSHPYVEGVLGGVPQAFESSLQLPDGSLHHYHIEYVPEQQIDGSTGLLVFAVDVTERVQQGMALAKSEQHTRSVLEAMAEGLVVQASDGRIVDANAAAPAMLGMTREQLLGRSSLDSGWQAILEDGSPLPGTEHTPMVALRTGQPVRNQVVGVQTPAGRRWLSINAQPLWSADGTVLTGAISTFTDITVQREQQLKAARFHEQIRSLARRFDQLRDTERHELAELLQRGLLAELISLKQAVANEGNTLLKQVSGAVEELRHVIFALKPPGIEELGFYEALVRFANDYGAQVELPITVIAPKETLPVAPEVLHALFRVIQEALSNIARHARASSVEVSLALADGNVRLRIRDDGIGISEQDWSKPNAFGLLAASERVARYGGTLRTLGVVRRGTLLEAVVPIAPPTDGGSGESS
jgi:PAS domain S-box-containing protein